MKNPQPVLERLPDLVASRRVRRSTLQVLPFWVAGALTGLVAVGYAQLFRALEHRFDVATSEAPWLLFVACPLAFLGSWALVHIFSPEAAGSGIPQLMAATTPAIGDRAVNRLLGTRAAIVKILSSSLAVAGGGAIGREGPTLQISGAIFRAVHARLPAFVPRAPMSSMVLAGGAAGLAAAFNTPLGGIVYAIEELARTHIGSFRSGVLHAVLVAGLVAQIVLGPYLYLGFPRLGVWTNQDLGWCALFGVAAGLVGALWARWLFAIVRYQSRLPTIRRKAAFALGSGIAFASLVYLTGQATLGSGHGLIEELLFRTEDAAGAGLVVGRLGGSLLSFACGGAGGIFAPALASGAALASGLAPLVSSVEPRLLIVLGMVGFLTGVTRTPFTSFVLVLEMTDRHSALFPMMIAAMSAYAASHMVDHRSFYERARTVILASESASQRRKDEAASDEDEKSV